MQHRKATQADVPFLARLNRQLYEDEGNRDRPTLAALEARMRKWLQTEYQCVVFVHDNTPVGYALYHVDSDGVFVRHLCVDRRYRRQGLGQEAARLLLSEVWPPRARVTLQVLATNPAGYVFWKALGFQDYATILEMLPKE